MFRSIGSRAAYPYWKATLLSKTAAGFTLLEVLLAFTIMALVLGALLQVFGGGLRGAALAKEYSIAALRAQSTLAVALSDPSLIEGTVSGEYDDGYRWKITISPFEEGVVDNDAAIAFLPQRLTVTVAWGDLRERSVTLTTLRLQPVALEQFGERG